MIDASAALEFLLTGPTSQAVADRLDGDAPVHAPHLIDLEIAHALRRGVFRGSIDASRAAAALALWGEVRIRRHSHRVLLDRIWGLRNNLTAYDAAYVALAEALGTTLVTADRRLARAPGVTAPIETL